MGSETLWEHAGYYPSLKLPKHDFRSRSAVLEERTSCPRDCMLWKLVLDEIGFLMAQSDILKEMDRWRLQELHIRSFRLAGNAYQVPERAPVLLSTKQFFDLRCRYQIG